MNKPQLPLPLEVVGRTPPSFLIGQCNRVAAELVLRWPDWPTQLVYLCGPPASGKSILVSEWTRHSSGAIIHAAESIPQTLTSNIAVEGIEALADEAGLFHLINEAALQRRSVLLTARLSPAALPVRLPDLQTRLRAATLAEIGPPDEAFLQELLVMLANRAQIAIDAAVASYCVTRMERTQLAAVNLISALNRRSLGEGRKVNLKMAAEVLGDAS